MRIRWTRAGKSIMRRGILIGVTGFVVAATVLTLLASVAHGVVAGQRPGFGGSQVGDGDVVRTPAGFRFAHDTRADTAGLPILGHVHYSIAYSSRGAPYPVHQSWAFSLISVDPAPGSAVPASDAGFWRRGFVEAVSSTNPFYGITPSVIREAQASNSVDRSNWMNTLRLGLYRLGRSIGWASAVLVASLFAGFLAAHRGTRDLRRQRKGKCRACGYDRRGLALGGACPECGTVPTA